MAPRRSPTKLPRCSRRIVWSSWPAFRTNFRRNPFQRDSSSKLSLDSSSESALALRRLLGKSAGAVYKPAAEIVPTAPFPPTTPLTLHVTAVLLAFVMSAENSCVFPSNTELDCGVTFTMMEGDGGGGGGPVTAPPPPQPSKLTPTASRSATLQQWESPVKICRRGRTAWRKAVRGPRVFPPFPRGCEFLAGDCTVH